ncbi:LysM peptidoglycan-binding domain-containing protein [Sphingobacteriales bacterium UPWRP_1]|nr:hypothetical protein BVG80_09550 [Sphingobacteriales bacterium TSM_CSM]PSJ78595.1 LysM peptidoglycan-binding domain-containing protein [Sphingobacteriales bacterium UPWRP_1]
MILCPQKSCINRLPTGLLLLPLLLLLLLQPATAQPIVERKHNPLTIAEYIDLYKGIAISEMKRTQIPASIIMAQGIIESRFGNSYLAIKARNHFGIKCHKGWKGMRILARDDEEEECFRKYKSAYASYIDHSNFLANNQRYSPLFNLPATDYNLWAKGLKEAGYATEPTYANQLTNLIINYRLFTLDQMATGSNCNCSEQIIATPMSYNGLKTVFFDCDITLKQVQQAYNISLEKLSKFNSFGAADTIRANTIVYLQQPKRKASSEFREHVAAPNETLESIAHLYGIKLNSLYKRNGLNKSKPLSAGQTVYLRGKKAKNNTAQANEARLQAAGAKLSYVVKTGDTLFSLAQRFNTSVDTIKRVNKLKSDSIITGQKLKIVAD